MKNIMDKIRYDLQLNSDETTKKTGLTFFKESVNLYGVKSAVVHKIGKEYLKSIRSMPKAEIFGLCEDFWRSSYLEESVIACDWSYSLHKLYEKEDLKIFEKWVNDYVSNWAACDTLCNHSVGAFIELYPESVSELKIWAKSKNLWMRRASAVAFIVPAKQGKFLMDILEIAEILLPDKEDLVQKGYGWMLKAASQAHQKEIFDFAMKNKAKMPRTALRYAVEKMPKALKDKAMNKTLA